VNRVAFLFNPATASYFEYYLSPFKAAASFGVEPIAAPFHNALELESVFVAHAREPNGGLIAMPDSFQTAHRAEITSVAARHRLPAVYAFRFFTEAGGLLSYGNDRSDNSRRSANFKMALADGPARESREGFPWVDCVHSGLSPTTESDRDRKCMDVRPGRLLRAGRSLPARRR
jgi:hypothetical protein